MKTMTLSVKSMENEDIMKVIVIITTTIIMTITIIMIITVKYAQSVKWNKKCSNKSNSCLLKTRKP